MSKTNRDRLLQMDNPGLTEFLFAVSETGSAYFLNAICETCDADCPESGCLYTPTEAIIKWLETEVELMEAGWGPSSTGVSLNCFNGYHSSA